MARFDASVVAWSLVLFAVSMVFYGMASYPQVVTVGVLYGLTGGGFILIRDHSSVELDIHVATRVVLAVFAVLFAFILGDLTWTRAGYAPIDASLVWDVTPLAVDRFSKAGPVGLFVLLGYADAPSERVMAVPPIVIWIGFVWVMELLGSYQGFGWPILPLIFTLVWFSLVLLAGLPLYVLGVSLTGSTR